MKLYTEEPESEDVRAWVTSKAEPLVFTSLHLSECVSAIRLKCFRGECREEQAARTILDFESDMASGVLRSFYIDWGEAWAQCRILSDAYAETTGCRTLDSLHVACAKQLGTREFITTGTRQSELAAKAGFQVRVIGFPAVRPACR